MVCTPQRKEIMENQTVFEVCKTDSDREGAYQLITRSYKRAGLIKESVEKVHFSSSQVTTFVVKRNGIVIGTVSSIPDEGSGSLPTDLLFRHEIDRLRAKNYILHSITCLATKRSTSLVLVATLISEILLYERRSGVDYVLIETSPHHAKIYRDLLGFEQLGAEKQYCGVDETNNRAPGTVWVPLILDLRNNSEHTSWLAARIARA